MPSGSTTVHEDNLPPATRDMHRAIVSLMEELEAVDWYQQRMDAAHDDELRDILRHNRDEEQEHAAMVLEWIRRRDPSFDAKLREYLFTTGSIVGREEAVERPGTASNGRETNGATKKSGGTVTLGSLRTQR
jgi:uncharacterized protein